MSIKDDLMDDLKKAMVAKDTVTKNTVQLIRATIKQTEIDKRIELKEDDILNIIAKQIKQKQDALEQFKKANRQDLIEQTEQEIKICEKYLPKRLSKEEVYDIVLSEKEVLGVSDMKGMGLLIKSVKEKVGLRSDGKTISDVVKDVLSNQ